MVNKIHETPKENGQNSERESNGKWCSCRQNIMISCAFILIDARKSAIYFMKKTDELFFKAIKGFRHSSAGEKF